ncbi:MAG TPA: Holliday junction resolvase RecU [Firmicutes bacterium]|nr:Holliday junction resolvase RecU [Bacillota bacterium]HBM70178.1 Holliday junction resolvase RecU [Bacillota bacterium]HBX25421.1 Holliday junction resolvase RecU [Bacillota bacterium]
MSEINYPKGSLHPLPNLKIKKKRERKLNLKVAPGNRGIDFEEAINQSNDYYKEKGLCLITKRPTPIKIVKVDYSHGAKITEAFFQCQSTTDYNGVYQGRYIDFEAKSTRNKTSFPLANIPPQQIEHLKNVLSQKGIAFFLINFHCINKTYLLDAKYVIEFYANKPRSSIPFSKIEEHGYLVKEGYRPRFDYLSIVKEHLL